MLQHKLKLTSEFNLTLKDCDELWVAVALISDFGFDFIQEHLNKNATQHYLVGIGLPTSPKVLSQLKQLETDKCKSKIHHEQDKFFHPKVYIIKTGSKLTAYVGSGNCTQGGLDKNLELTIKIEDQTFCNNLLTWFNSLFKFGKPITDDFLKTYSELFDRRVERVKQDRKELKFVFPDDSTSFNLDNIDFTNQFFKAHHYKAFEGTKPLSHSDSANQERMEVRKQLFKLHDKLLPKIKAKRWDLHEHYETEHIVSSAVHSSYTSDELGGIWLHYGRNKTEIKKYGEDETPLDYMRLQVIVHKDNVGIWNRVGKDNGSRIDRDNLHSKLSDTNYRHKFYSALKSLPDSFFIVLNGQTKLIKDFSTEQELIDFVLTDNRRFYFIIGTEFLPGAIELSEANIVDTVIDNFEKLYPTYEIIKHKLGL